MRNRRSVKNLLDHRSYITEHGDDLPEIRNLQWGDASGSKTANAETAVDNIFEHCRERHLSAASIFPSPTLQTRR